MMPREPMISMPKGPAAFSKPTRLRKVTFTPEVIATIDASSEVCKTQVTDFQAEVLGIEQLSDSTISLSLKVEDASRLHFLPGQYVKIQVPGEQDSRSYSFSSPPGSDVATFLIRNVPGGLMSSYLTERAKPGDKLTIKGPLGSFYLRDTKRPVLMLAGGTGLAPFLSMLGKVAETGCDQPIHLVYGVTNDGDLVEVETIAEYVKKIPSFTFATCVADKGSNHPLKGYVTHHLEAKHLNAGDVDVYLCGPPPMVDAALALLDNHAVPKDQVFYDKFTSPATDGV